jgi:hypothetical protein
VPTLGRARWAPPGTDSGQKLRLRGKGIAAPSGSRPATSTWWSRSASETARRRRARDALAGAARDRARLFDEPYLDCRSVALPRRQTQAAAPVAAGPVREEELESVEAEELRVAVLWMRDLGVNPAGVDVALQLRRRLLALEARLHEALEQLKAGK